MQIKKRDNKGEDILICVDYKNSRSIWNDIKKLGKKYESKSNINNLKYSILFNLRKTPYMTCKGWSSRVILPGEGVKEIIFVDYDSIVYSIMETELNYIMNKYNLSPFYILRTTKEQTDKHGNTYANYLAISITKKLYGEIIDGVHKELHCDSSFKIIPKFNNWRTWVTRLGPKGKKGRPEFKSIIGDLNKSYDMDCSRAHLTLLEKIYPDIKDKVKYTNLDKGKADSIYMDEYETAST